MAAYILLNKNTPILSFVYQKNRFDDEETKITERYSEQLPLGFVDLLSFLSGRVAPKHRKHIQELLMRYGCNDLEGFLNLTHAASLNDTYWVKREDETLCWQDVSLYRNDFNDLIARAAFDGDFSGTALSATSPEFSTDGGYAKCWVREKDGIYLYKTGSDTYEIEPVSEYLASQLAQIICPKSVQYDLAWYRGKLISKCALFTSEQVGLCKGKQLLQEHQMLHDIATVEDVLQVYEKYGFGDFCRRMFLLDALILNIDRHLGNFGVLFDTDTRNVVAPAPVYDNNRSLLFMLDEDQLQNAAWYADRQMPRLGSSFVGAAKGMLTDALRQELKNLSGWQYTQHPTIEIPPTRLQALSGVTNRQIKWILG